MSNILWVVVIIKLLNLKINIITIHKSIMMTLKSQCDAFGVLASRALLPSRATTIIDTHKHTHTHTHTHTSIAYCKTTSGVFTPSQTRQLFKAQNWGCTRL